LKPCPLLKLISQVITIQFLSHRGAVYG
jgi:hypothetical protein